uniref:DUF1997 domain-containing protein n=1 Tax=Tanacetum cinerariifolium TaxID=118510 RepID=A0A6L2MP32_TANCI|nr:DUF1997 domain-containing protein [Tanacetum cinerariifolium]
MKPHVFHNIDNGHTTSVWYDEWNKNGPLSNVITKRDIYDTRFSDSDKVVDLIENGIWKWSSDWYERFLMIRSIEVPALKNCYDRIVWLIKKARLDHVVIILTFRDMEDSILTLCKIEGPFYLRTESIAVRPLERPLLEYMSLPASQYSVLDAQRIERIDDTTFRCYVYKFKFFAFEVCPVLLVRVEEQPNGCSINLLSCKLEGSPIVVAQNDKFDASMVNRISCDRNLSSSTMQQLTSDTVIEVSIDIPFPFQALPVETIESSGTQVLEQILKIMLPRFMAQLVKDYEAWASGDTSRQPLGNGGI